MHDTYRLKCNAVNNTYFSPRVTVQFACEGFHGVPVSSEMKLFPFDY